MIKLLGVIQKVRSLRRGGWIIEKRTKANSGWGSQHVCTFAFLKKNAGIFKMKFYSYYPVFPIDYHGRL